MLENISKTKELIFSNHSSHIITYHVHDGLLITLPEMKHSKMPRNVKSWPITMLCVIKGQNNKQKWFQKFWKCLTLKDLNNHSWLAFNPTALVGCHTFKSYFKYWSINLKSINLRYVVFRKFQKQKGRWKLIQDFKICLQMIDFIQNVSTFVTKQCFSAFLSFYYEKNCI